MSMCKDKLASYFGTTISYSGFNPTNWRNASNLTWRGRQLISRTYNSVTTSYEYNSDGLRTKKTTGTDITEYIWDGDRLIREINPDRTITFLYDGDEITGFSTGGSNYYYAKDSFGVISYVYNEDGMDWYNGFFMEDNKKNELHTVCEVLYMSFIVLKGYVHVNRRTSIVTYLRFLFSTIVIRKIIMAISEGEDISKSNKSLGYLIRLINTRSSAVYVISSNIKKYDLFIRVVVDELVVLSNLLFKYAKKTQSKKNRFRIVVLLELIHSLPKTMFINKNANTRTIGNFDDIFSQEQKLANSYHVYSW